MTTKAIFANFHSLVMDFCWIRVDFLTWLPKRSTSLWQEQLELFMLSAYTQHILWKRSKRAFQNDQKVCCPKINVIGHLELHQFEWNFFPNEINMLLEGLGSNHYTPQVQINKDNYFKRKGKKEPCHF